MSRLWKDRVAGRRARRARHPARALWLIAGGVAGITGGWSSALALDISPPVQVVFTPAVCQPSCGGGGSGSGYMGSSLSEGQSLDAGQYLASPSGSYVFVMQSDGNLVEYQGNTPLWASGTSVSGGYDPGVFVILQSSDGNLVVYDHTGARWSSHTNNHQSGNVLEDQDDGNMVIYDGGAIWATGTDTSQRSCWTNSNNNCTPTTWAYSVLGQAPASIAQGLGFPTTTSNIYALTKWEQREGGGGYGANYCGGSGWPQNDGAKANPVGSTYYEQGATNGPIWNYNDATDPVTGQYHRCWYWGIRAFVANVRQTQFRGYQQILNVLQNPVLDSHQQCLDLNSAVAYPASQWGTPDFASLC